ncbi:hypothetical protein [Natronoarchaeum rubrum]|uniref:hypothetical protein n=1 Tax=Natronoarchaeum rubrum TaxID=755311 RepID=UPI002110F210|nr:hypothetical protein [Natronoarchaeum rubrum]
MVSTVGVVYVVGVTVLFFFWVYGIYAFGRDVRRRYLPALRAYLEQRESDAEAARAEEEREEREQQLY